MSHTNRLLDEIAAIHGGASDYRLGKLLDEPRQVISTYRNCKRWPPNRVAFKMAQLLDRDPADLIALIEIDRASTDNEREFWKRIAQPVAACLALALVGVGCVALPEHAFAAEATSVYYVKLALVAILLAASFRSAANASPNVGMRIRGL